MNKLLYFCAFLLVFVAAPAFAGTYDFAAYTPTLNRLYATGDSPINSFYNSINFSASPYIVTDNPLYNGTIYNGAPDEITSDIFGYFIQNSRQETTGAYSDLNITGDFLDNYAVSDRGGAVYNFASEINITGDFIHNGIANQSGEAWGGAIANYFGGIKSISGNFVENFVITSCGSCFAEGGAIYNFGTINNITGDFIGNYAESVDARAAGGAIFNIFDSITISGSFINNYAYSLSNNRALGGAVYTAKDLTFSSAGRDIFISGNWTQDNSRGKRNNAIFIDTALSDKHSDERRNLRFNTTDGGTITVDDEIEGATEGMEMGYYNKFNIFITGDGTGVTTFNNAVIGSGSVSIDNSTLKLGNENIFRDGIFNGALTEQSKINLYLSNNGTLDIANGVSETFNVGDLNSNNGFISLDIADVLNVTGTMTGNVDLILNGGSGFKPGDEILFATVNSTNSLSNYDFNVFRVYGNPYTWSVSNTGSGSITPAIYDYDYDYEFGDSIEVGGGLETGGIPDPTTDWYLTATGGVVSNVVSYIGLQGAAIEQTRNMLQNVIASVNNTNHNHEKHGEGITSNHIRPEDVWVTPIHNSASMENPVNMDASIYGVEFGFDIYNQNHNSYGLFGSVRKGSYEFDGKTKSYPATTSSDLEITSYYAGLYYEHKLKNFNILGTVYGGTQRSDIETDDGVKVSANGMEFGLGGMVEYIMNFKNHIDIKPNFGFTHRQISYGAFQDDYGLAARPDTLSQTLVEGSVKIEKAIRLGDEHQLLGFYVAPGFIQTITFGDRTNIDGLGDVNTVQDRTMGSIEVGARLGMSARLDSFVSATVISGGDYNATSLRTGFKYIW